MEELERKLLEIILKQNKIIIMQNNAIIEGLDCINDGMSRFHTPSYPKKRYSSAISAAQEALEEFDSIQKELSLSK